MRRDETRESMRWEHTPTWKASGDWRGGEPGKVSCSSGMGGSRATLAGFTWARLARVPSPAPAISPVCDSLW